MQLAVQCMGQAKIYKWEHLARLSGACQSLSCEGRPRPNDHKKTPTVYEEALRASQTHIRYRHRSLQLYLHRSNS